MSIPELSRIEEKVKQMADILSQEEQAVLYHYLFFLGHRISESEAVKARIGHRKETTG